MINELAPRKGNGAELAQLDATTIASLVLDGDLSKLNNQQRVAYYNYRCRALDLDPATKPFDLIKLNGKLVLYALKECSSQIAKRDKLAVTIVDRKREGDIYVVQARVAQGERFTDDVGCVDVKALGGEALCNAIMKATTKAKRRAILAHCGLGMLDESELETIPAAVRETVEAPRPRTASAPGEHVPIPCPDGKPGCAVAHYAPTKQIDAQTVPPREPGSDAEERIPLVMPDSDQRVDEILEAGNRLMDEAQHGAPSRGEEPRPRGTPKPAPKAAPAKAPQGDTLTVTCAIKGVNGPKKDRKGNDLYGVQLADGGGTQGKGTWLNSYDASLVAVARGLITTNESVTVEFTQNGDWRELAGFRS